MKNFVFIIALLFSLTSLTANAASLSKPDIATICSDVNLEAYPIQSGGRVKPLRVHSEEILKFITGKKNNNGRTATQIFCRLSLKSMMPVDESINVLVEHVDTKKLLGIAENIKEMQFSEIVGQTATIEFEYNKTKEKNGAYHKDLSKLLTRIDFAKAITSGKSWTFFDPKVDNWTNLNLYLNPSSLQLHEEKSSKKGLALISDYLAQSKPAYIKAQNDDFLLELQYSKLKLFSWAILTVLLAIIALTLFSTAKPAIFFTILTILIEVVGITMRVFISGRAPITNMYETVMFSGFGALVIGCIIASIKKDKLYLYGGLGYNFLCLLMINFANSMLDAAISPLVPVLRDNFWLSTHVTCIILSYAALALSWMTANIVLIQNSLSRLTAADYRKKSEIVFNCIKVGTILLSAGIILGGIWADYSWGRFWGWDPKETWSLIVLLIYMAIVHGRHTAWIPKERFILLTAAAFMSVMMAWFGVNYILASGLHSYGFSEGGAIFLGSFFIIQIIILIVTIRKPMPLKQS